MKTDSGIEKRGHNMNDAYIVQMDGDQIRFTQDGHVYLLDAIKAVSGSDSERDIWRRLKLDHPEIIRLCERHTPEGGDGDLVVDPEGWDKIWMLLSEYLFFMDS